MSGFLGQLVLGAWRLDGDDSGWMQLLVFVVLAVIYGVGSLVKAKKQKLDEQGDEELARKPVRRPQQGARERQRRPIGQSQRPVRPVPQRGVGPEVQQKLRKTAYPTAVSQKMAVEKERTGLLEALTAATKLQKFPPAGPQVEPDFEELPEYTQKTIEKFEDMQLGIPSEAPDEEYLAEILPDLTGPDEIKKAILHYEILGKALSLREPNEQLF